MKIELDDRDLNANGKIKAFEDLTLSDFTVRMGVFYQAHEVIYVKDGRTSVLKSREFGLARYS